MNVEQLGSFLRAHWLKIKERLCEGSYEPMSVRRVQIPEAAGVFGRWAFRRYWTG